MSRVAQFAGDVVYDDDAVPTHFIAIFKNNGYYEQTVVAPLSEYPKSIELVEEVLKMECVAVFMLIPKVEVEDKIYRLSNYKLQ